MEAAPHPWPALGVLLLRDGLVQKEELESLLDEQRDSRQHRISGWRLGEILIERGLVTQAQVAKLLAEQYELPYLELHEPDIDPKVAARLADDLADRFSALPIEALSDGSLLLAVADPAAVLFSDELRRAIGMPVRFTVVAPDAMASAIAFVREQTPVEATDPQSWPSSPQVLDGLHATPGSPITAEHPAPHTLLLEPAAGSWPPLGTLLVRDGLITEEELETALAQQRLSSNKRLGEILVERGAVTRTDVARIVAEQYELPFIDLAASELDPRIGALLGDDLARRYSAVPVRFEPDGSLLVAVADPTKVLDPDEILAALGARLTFAVADPDAIDSAILLQRLEVEPAAVEHPVALPHPPPVVAVEEPQTEPAVEATVVEDGAEAFETDVDAGISETEPVEIVSLETEPETFAVVDDDGPAAASFAAGEAALSEDEVAAEENAQDEEPLVVADDAPREEHPHATATTPDAEPSETDAPEVAATEAAEPEPVGAEPMTDESWMPRDESAGAAGEEPPEQETDTELEAHTAFADGESVEELAPSADHDATEEPWTEALVEEPEVETPVDAPTSTVDVEAILDHALALGATTVHFSPQEQGLTVRARVDGVLRELEIVTDGVGHGVEPTASTFSALENRADLEVTVLPTQRGNSVTVHVRTEPDVPGSLQDLQMADDDEVALRSALARPSGLVLVAGPAGSGRTTTLYAALQELNTPDRALVTLEDPVWHPLPGVDHVAVDRGSGLTYPAGLREILQADPDVILVDEISDAETAELAVNAAASHLVLAGVLAPTAASAVQRLAGLGIRTDALASTLRALVTQRLARRICFDCRESYYPTTDELAELGRPGEEAGRRLLGRGRGCPSCGGSGFRGRVGVYSLVPLTEEIRTLVAEGASPAELERGAIDAGARTVRDAAGTLCLEGITTTAEVRRIVGLDG